MKPRLFVLTDISSLEAGVNEPDDGQSLIRLLSYADRFEFEGLCASSNLGYGACCRPELIETALDAYTQDFPILQRHGEFPNPRVLRHVVSAGWPFAGPDISVEACIGENCDTGASELLLLAVEKDETDKPLWICVWGGTADLAQALWKARETKSKAHLKKLVACLRVHATELQDATGAWILSEFPDLFFIERNVAFRGMYRGGDESLCNRAWVETNVEHCGALGSLYPNYDDSDLWGHIKGVKECDSPTYLNLLSGNPLSGWGGTFIETAPHRFSDEVAPDASPTDHDPRMAGIYRHRAAFQSDWKRRLDWLR
ncbi:hypothetical protein IAD21_04961 [Abditibacteriota bacterium]|nr:hypothetical protein IAD21_04961 [Abditibacteriota bacterium]